MPLWFHPTGEEIDEASVIYHLPASPTKPPYQPQTQFRRLIQPAGIYTPQTHDAGGTTRWFIGGEQPLGQLSTRCFFGLNLEAGGAPSPCDSGYYIFPSIPHVSMKDDPL